MSFINNSDLNLPPRTYQISSEEEVNVHVQEDSNTFELLDLNKSIFLHKFNFFKIIFYLIFFHNMCVLLQIWRMFHLKKTCMNYTQSQLETLIKNEPLLDNSNSLVFVLFIFSP